MRDLESTPAFDIRSATPEDLPYIYATWLKGQRKVGHHSFLTDTIYYEHEKKRIGGILERSSIGIISNPEDENHIIGYVVFDFLEDIFVLHYAHIKRAYQGLGIVKKVVETLCPKHKRKSGFYVTHFAPQLDRARQTHNFRYNPYVMNLIQKFKEKSE